MVCSIRSKTVNIQNNEDVDHLGPWKQDCNVDCHHSKHLDLIFQSVRQHILLQYTLLYVKSILLGDGGLRMNDVFIQITAWFLRVFFFFLLKIILFIYLLLCWVFTAVWAFNQSSEQGDYALVVVQRLLVAVASLVEHRLDGIWAQ